MIDFDGILERTISLNVTPRNYSQLRAGPAGTVFFLETVPASGVSGGQQGGTVHRYMLSEREAKPFMTGVQSTRSRRMEEAAYRSAAPDRVGRGGSWTRTGPRRTGRGRLNVAPRSKVDPRAEWRQMFIEGWRFQRDFLYVANLHGADYQR